MSLPFLALPTFPPQIITCIVEGRVGREVMSLHSLHYLPSPHKYHLHCRGEGSYEPPIPCTTYLPPTNITCIVEGREGREVMSLPFLALPTFLPQIITCIVEGREVMSLPFLALPTFPPQIITCIIEGKEVMSLPLLALPTFPPQIITCIVERRGGGKL